VVLEKRGDLSLLAPPHLSTLIVGWRGELVHWSFPPDRRHIAARSDPQGG